MHNNYGGGKYTTCSYKRPVLTLPFGYGNGISCRSCDFEWQKENFFDNGDTSFKILYHSGLNNKKYSARSYELCRDRYGAK